MGGAVSQFPMATALSTSHCLSCGQNCASLKHTAGHEASVSDAQQSGQGSLKAAAQHHRPSAAHHYRLPTTEQRHISHYHIFHRDFPSRHLDFTVKWLGTSHFTWTCFCAHVSIIENIVEARRAGAPD